VIFIFVMNTPGKVTSTLVEGWKHSLTAIGHAVCVHYQCRLCFLSLSGIVSHHRNCRGWTSPNDYIPCMHCGARFKQFKSCQTHSLRNHQHLFGADSDDDSDMKSEVVSPPRISPPPLPIPPAPDVVPRPDAIRARRLDGSVAILIPASRPNSIGGTSSSTPGSGRVMAYREDPNLPQSSSVQHQDSRGIQHADAPTTPTEEVILEDNEATSSSQGLISHRENVLVEKELRLTQLETLVKQAEMKAEQAKKTRELAAWEKDLQRREREARRRLADAEKILRENSVSSDNERRRQFTNARDIPTTAADLSTQSLTSRALGSIRSFDLSPPNLEESIGCSFNQSRRITSPAQSSNFVHNPPITTATTTIFTTPHYRHYNPGPSHTSTPFLRLPNTIPIVLPSTAKLPPSAIRLAPSPLPRNLLPSIFSHTNSQDSPINLSKSKNDQISSQSDVPTNPVTFQTSNSEKSTPTSSDNMLTSSCAPPSSPPQRSSSAGSPVLRSTPQSPYISNLCTPQHANSNSSNHEPMVTSDRTSSELTLSSQNTPNQTHSTYNGPMTPSRTQLSVASPHIVATTVTQSVLVGSSTPASQAVASVLTHSKSSEPTFSESSEPTSLITLGPAALVSPGPSSLRSTDFASNNSPGSTTLESIPPEPIEPTSIISSVATSLSSVPSAVSVSCTVASDPTAFTSNTTTVSSVSASLVSPSVSDVPCVEISKETVMEIQVGVVEDGSLESGANISFPFSDSTVETNFLFSDSLDLDQLLNSSGGKIVNLVATEGPDGSMTLTTSNLGEENYSEPSTGLFSMENELEEIKKSINEIQNEVVSDNNIVDETLKTPCREGHERETSKINENQHQVLSPIKLHKSKAAIAALTNNMEEDSLESIEKQIEEHTKETGGDLVNYFEMRLKEFETEIAQKSSEESFNELSNSNEKNIATASAIIDTAVNSVVECASLAGVDSQVMQDENEKVDEPRHETCDIAINNETIADPVNDDIENIVNEDKVEFVKPKKKRKRDCPGTSWFGCSNYKRHAKAKKRKMEVKSVEEKGNPDKVNQSRERRSTRLKSRHKVQASRSTSSSKSFESQVPSSSSKRRLERNLREPNQAVTVTLPTVRLSKLPSITKTLSSPSSKQGFLCGKCPSIFTTERDRLKHQSEFHAGGARTRALVVQASKCINSVDPCPKRGKTLCNIGPEEVQEGCEVNEVLDDGINCTGTSKVDIRVPRKAAAKAQGKVAEFVKQMKTKFEDESSEAEGDISDGSDENYDVKNEADVTALYKVASDGKSRQRYKCTVCGENFASQDQVESHVVTQHQEEILSDDDDEEEDEDEVESSDYADDSDDDGRSERRRYKRRSKTPFFGHRRLHLEPWPKMILMEHRFRSRFFHLNDFLCFSANLSSWVAETQENSFLPSSAISSRFTVTSIPPKEENEEEVRILSRFSGGVINDSPMMFCGGPISAMAWCPSKKQEQVLAVVAKLDFDATRQGEKKSARGLIQFWKMGNLDVEGARQEPTLKFSLGHHFGCVKEIEWCPSLGRELGRQGLIAAACGDGSVRLWTIPSLDSVKGEGMMYVREPDMSLVCGEKIGQCLALSWYRGPGHNYIAASYSSGLVCLWYLATMSSLLKDGSTLLPVQSWLAHTGSVTGLSICPGEEERPKYLITGGSDRCYRFWDLNNVAVPLQEVKRGLVSGVAWIPGWNGGSVTYDDVYLQGHTQSIITETGYYTTKPSPVLAQNSSVLDQDMSHWIGTIAIGTAAGELVVFAIPPLDRSLEHDKNLGQRRTYVYRTEMTRESKEQLDLRQYENMKDVSLIKYIDMPITKSTVEMSTTKDMVRVRVAERMDMEDLTCFPLSSITKVAWNNNLGSQLWLVSGGQSGLVRAHCVQVLNTVRVKEALKEVEGEEKI